MNITKKFASLAVGAALASGIGIASATPARAAGSVWDSVAACESSGNWSTNTGNGYYGGLQFSESTWLAYGGGAYAHYASDATRAQQIAVAQKVLAAQGVNAWPVCGPKAGLTTSNGGASSSSTASTTTTGTTSTSSSTTSTTGSKATTSSSASGSRRVATTAHRVAPKPTVKHKPAPRKGAPKPPAPHEGSHHHVRPPHGAHHPAPQPR